MRSWLNVGHVCELPEPGSFIRRELEFARASLLIVRRKDGGIGAYHNVCTHRGTQLVDAEAGRQPAFSCRYHGWTFGLDGALVGAPDFERFYTTKQDCALKQVAVDVCAGLIFVCFEPKEPLRAFLGDTADQLETLPLARATTFHEYEYEVEANWKLIYDNFQEAYHLRFIHPQTSLPSIQGINPFGYPSSFSLYDKHRSQTVWAEPGAPVADCLVFAYTRGAPRLGQDGVLDHPLSREYFGIYPNLFLLDSPGSPFLHLVYPLGPTRSRGLFRQYWIGEDETASVRYAREFSLASTRDVFAEDLSPMEAGQRGVSSGAIEHVQFQAKEILCRQLAVVVQDAMAKYQDEMRAKS
jgi:phenylpropionate dioxygenase-like ring-hydroxylating dioxygenase large terminal subunit